MPSFCTRHLGAALCGIVWLASAGAQEIHAETALQSSVNQLRHVIGQWNVRTEFLNPDGSVAR